MNDCSLMTPAKEKLLLAALQEFAENGYDGLSVADLMSRLGLVKSALYRHFKSKEDLFEGLMDYMEDYYESHFFIGNGDRPIQTLEDFKETSLARVSFSIDDPKVICCRRILLREQFTHPRCRELVNKYFYRFGVDFFAFLFEGMMERGLLREGDPQFLASSFFLPISAFISYADRNPDEKEEVKERIASFIDSFLAQYGVKP